MRANVDRFHTFFQHIDHYKSDYFLWVTASGIAASKQALAKGEAASKLADIGLDAEGETGNGAQEG